MMAFKKDEMNQLKLVVTDAISPLKTDIALINQKLNEKGGIVDKVNCIEDKIMDLRIFKKQVYAVVGSIQAIGIGVMTWLKFNK